MINNTINSKIVCIIFKIILKVLEKLEKKNIQRHS